MQIMAVEQEVTQTPSTNIKSFLAYKWEKKTKHDQKYVCILRTVAEVVVKDAITKRQIIL
jgi:hypothetical protein